MDQKSNSRLIVSIILSCTRNVAIGILSIYLLYYIVDFTIDNSGVITNYISNISNNIKIYLTPFYTLILNNIFVILAINWTLFVWLFCIRSKLDLPIIRIPFILHFLVFMFLLFGGILCLIACKVLTGILSFISFVIGIFSIILFLLVVFAIILHKKEDDNPNQLELFDNKNKLL